MKRLVIVGAGGLGREVLSWCELIPEDRRDWRFGGFLDARANALEGFGDSLRVIGDPDTYAPRGDELLICAIGDARTRLAVCARLEARGAHFGQVCHCDSLVSPAARLGCGAIVATDATIGPDARLGRHCVVLGATMIGAGAVLGAGVTVSGYAVIGEEAVLGEGVLLGSHAIIAPGTVVGDYARIGARTSVSGTVPSGATCFGVPGRIIAGF